MATELFTPRKAQRKVVKLKMAIQGPSGSGKTEGALALASNFMPHAKILVIDTENDSASLYADRYEFDTITLSSPYASERYQSAMSAAVSGGYDFLIVDSLTQQWDGDGGILRRKEAADRVTGSNGYANWAKFTPEHTRFVEFIKNLPVHTICTMRSKQDYILETNEKGKQQPRKVGMAPIQRDGLEYEFTLVFDVNMNHMATASKNRTTLFSDEEPIDLRNPAVAASLRTWLDTGVLLPPPIDTPEGQVHAEVERQQSEQAVPAELDWSYVTATGILICRVLSAETRPKKSGGGTLLAVRFNGEIEGKKSASYFHESHRELILGAVGKVCKFVAAVNNGYVNLEDVLEIDGVKVESESSPNDETTARLLASALGFTEEELHTIVTRHSGGSWKEAVAKMQALKERNDGATTD